MTESQPATAVPSTPGPPGPVAGYRGRRAVAVAAMLVAFANGMPRFLTHTPYPRFGVVLDWASAGAQRMETTIAAPSKRRMVALLERPWVDALQRNCSLPRVGEYATEAAIVKSVSRQ